MAGLGFLPLMVLLVVAPIAIFRSSVRTKAALHIVAWCGSRTGGWNCAWSTIEKRSTGRGSWVRTDVLWWHLGFRSQN
jgi:hypothetical protein